MAQDERQFEFEFMPSITEKADTQKMEALYKVRTFDCSKEQHQILPNGTCMLCRKQIAFGTNQDGHDV